MSTNTSGGASRGSVGPSTRPQGRVDQPARPDAISPTTPARGPEEAGTSLATCECCDAALGPDAHCVSADAAVCETCRREHYASPDDDDTHGAGCLCAECEDPAWDDPPTRDSFNDLDEVEV